MITLKVRKKARNRYNQVPHLSQDTKWESNKITINITNKSQEVSSYNKSRYKNEIKQRLRLNSIYI